MFLNLFLLLLLASKKFLSWYTSIIIMFIMTFMSLTMVYSPDGACISTTESLFLDGFSSPLISLSCWVSALMVLASNKVLTSKQNELHFLLFVSTLMLILVLTFMSSNVIYFYILFEASLIPTLLLILGWGYQPERLQAGLYLMMYTVIASLPLLVNLMWLQEVNSHLSFMLPLASPFGGGSTSSFSLVWFLFIILAFMVKLPMFTVHLWLPKAHVEAPVAGSMILAGILLKLGAYGMMRMMLFFPVFISPWVACLSSLAMWGGISTSMICLRQTDMKSLIAYSSVGHMGILMAGALTNTAWGWSGALCMMLAHGLCSSAMFAIANITYGSSHSRSLFLSKGMMLIFPSMAFWWFLLSAANMAAPPSLNLLSEIFLMTSVLSMSASLTLALGLMSFLAGAYSIYLFVALQHGSLSNYLLPKPQLSPSNFSMLLLHVMPLNALILKPEIMSLWLC
uniref:NADH-ubiquinone oxidoreductase chain 4 n=1 Tax=Magelona mirabilis TaxID=46598 RepID=A0A0S2N0D4_9ANNE|nr:NADH dehydrogenase subunit 4 [Magelona mirabilis]ALO81682.1 NADH dehydrogenase subunit 4 [Magelona mirabilis]